MRSAAPDELPKVRLCAHVVGTVLCGMGSDAVAEAVGLLRAYAGAGWSTTHALQFLSGRQAEFAIDCAVPREKAVLYAAHLLAKEVCAAGGLGGAAPIHGIDLAALRALAQGSAID